VRKTTIVIWLCVLWSTATASAETRLRLKEAERQALDHHPQIRASQYAALAAAESIREARSAYFPTAFGSFTGAGAQDGTRIAAGGLNNPTILDRFAAGVGVSQLITDFGRTSSMVRSSALTADSRDKEVDARRADVLLQVDRAYFNALRAQAIREVAEQTVEARKLVVDQVEALTASDLKSSLDLSFAKVNLGEAQLLAHADAKRRAGGVRVAVRRSRIAGGDHVRARRRADAAAATR
jgi:outer membrane protein